MAFEFTDQNFETEALQEGNIAVVDFWAEWCGPCRMVGPVVEELSKEYEGRAVVGKLNVDHNPKVATDYGIMSIPALLIFKNGQLVDKQVGAVPKHILDGKLKAQIA